MSEIENRQRTMDGTESFEQLIKDYSPGVPFGPLERDPYDARNYAPDIIKNQEIADQPATEGSKPEDSTVRSVYDTRPINAYDAIFDVAKSDGSALQQGNNLYTISVPVGTNVVIRGVKFVINPVPAVSIDDRDYLLTLLLNGAAVPHYQDIPVGPVLDFFLPCHVIAGDNQTFGLRFNVVPAIPVATFFLNAQFHCNLLLSTGQTANLVVGNTPRQPYEPPIEQQKPALPENYERYKTILTAGKQLKLVNASMAIPPFSAFKAAYSPGWWQRVMGPLILGVKNLTGKDI